MKRSKVRAVLLYSTKQADSLCKLFMCLLDIAVVLPALPDGSGWGKYCCKQHQLCHRKQCVVQEMSEL